MDNYKKAERLLESYKALKGYIEIKKKDLEEAEYQGISAVCLNEKTGKTYKINDPVFNEVVNMVKYKEEIEKEINKNQSLINKVDRALKKIPNEERKILELRYFEGMQWWEVISIIPQSERWCKELRNRGLRKVSVYIYGGGDFDKS